jgi:hypothetical protein
MGKLFLRPSSVNPRSLPLNSRAICPWCGSEMYLDRSGDRLLCADPIRCAGVMDVEPKFRALAVKEVAA